jgi:hypothetical protein
MTGALSSSMGVMHEIDRELNRLEKCERVLASERQLLLSPHAPRWLARRRWDRRVDGGSPNMTVPTPNWVERSIALDGDAAGSGR